MANLTDADKVLRNDVGKSIVSKLDDIADAIVRHGSGAESLGQLSDVDIDTTTLAEGQSIVYNETTQKFENGEVSTVAASDLTPKTFSTTTPISIQANETVTQQFTVNNAKYGIITGFAITSNLNVVALQFYFYNATTVQVRVKNVSNANDVFHISFFYI